LSGIPTKISVTRLTSLLRDVTLDQCLQTHFTFLMIAAPRATVLIWMQLCIIPLLGNRSKSFSTDCKTYKTCGKFNASAWFTNEYLSLACVNVLNAIATRRYCNSSAYSCSEWSFLQRLVLVIHQYTQLGLKVPQVLLTGGGKNLTPARVHCT
jgi:hypothetical protein